MHGTRLLTVLVALGLIVGSVPGGALGATGAADAGDIGSPGATTERLDASTVSAQTDGNATNDENATDDGNANGSDADDGASRATVGQQLATVISVTDDEVSGDVAAASLDSALEDANESERAAVLAERSAALRERADEIVADQREARVAYEDGEMARGEFAQRLAVLAGQAQTVDRGFERIADGADDTSGIELRAAGYDRNANADARERLTRVTGTGASALLAQYTGERAGEFSLDVDGGVSIEVESDDGERSREIEREQPGNGTFEVSQSEALTAATEQLSTDADGEWTLRSADRDEGDGYYEFEFTFFGPETTGEAEVSVDGQTGEVFEFEEELEPREQDDDGDDADETPLSISIVNGTADPGATVTLRVTAAGEPVEDATVELNDQGAGTTDADGRITVTLPDDDEVDIEAEDGDREGELEITLRSETGDDGDDDFDDRFSVDGSVENGTVDVSVTYDGESVEGVSVSVNDELVGTTDADGSLSFDAPSVDDELKVTLVKGAFEAEIEFEVGADGTLVADDIDVDERDADGEGADDDSDDADGEDADDDSDDADDLSVAVVSGDLASGSTVTIEVTDADGEPVEGASVEVEGEFVGATDADGRITVTLPDDDEVDIEVEDGDREGELEIEFADAESADDDADDIDDGADDDADDEDSDDTDGDDDVEDDDEEDDDEEDADDEEGDE